MRKKLFLMLTLLCAAAQGAWADDGWSSASSYDKDSDADKPTHYDTYGGTSSRPQPIIFMSWISQRIIATRISISTSTST